MKFFRYIKKRNCTKMRALFLIFVFIFFHFISNSQCIVTDNVSVNPLPVGGTYQPGQVITFTYTITNYQGLSVNWLHGIVPQLGPGWLSGSLQSN